MALAPPHNYSYSSALVLPNCPNVRAGLGSHLLAKVEEELLEDKDGSCAAKDDERLSREEAEQGASHGSAQEALHHSLRAQKSVRLCGGRGGFSTQVAN